MLVTQRVSLDALFHELDGRREGVFRIGDCVAPRLLAEAIFDGHRLAREIDGDDPEVALPYLRERVGDSDELPPAAAPRSARRAPAAPAARAAHLRVHRRHRRRGRAHRRAAALGRAPRRSWPSARARARRSIAGRRLAERYGARLAVSRPQVEAGRATRAELVGASGATVAPRAYLALGISGALPHLVGMAGSETVVAVNRDRGARIFEYADLGVDGRRRRC